MNVKCKLFILTMLTVFSSISVFAQSGPTAKSILDKVSSTYASYKTIMADFTLSGKNSIDNSKFDEKGRVYLEPGSGRYKIETGQHALISDGKTQWSVLTDLGEVQITDVNPNDKSLNPTNIFYFYQDGYSMRKMNDEVAGGESLHSIELTPTNNSQNVSKIKLRISKVSAMIYDASVYDKNGNIYTYSLNNIDTNKKFSVGIFQFYKHNYPGIEVVDLR